MRNSTKKRAPIICAAVMIGLLVLYLAGLLAALIAESQGMVLAVVFLVFYGLVILLVIVGILIALRQRLRELKGGEEEDAKKY